MNCPKAGSSGVLLHPEKAVNRAPENFKVLFTVTTGKSRGRFVIQVHRAWSPIGADRFYNLVRVGYYKGAPFFRVIPGFVAQVGISGCPSVNGAWKNAYIKDDVLPAGRRKSNVRGYVSFGTDSDHPGWSRTTHIFINYADNSGKAKKPGAPRLDDLGFTPFGYVDARGMAAADKLYGGLGRGFNEPKCGCKSAGECADKEECKGPDQDLLEKQGNAYAAQFPGLDYVLDARIIE